MLILKLSCLATPLALISVICFCSLSCWCPVSLYSEKTLSTNQESANALILDFQTPEVWEVNFCCLLASGYGILLLEPAAAAKSLQSCPTLCDPIDGSPLGSSVPGILQARILEWVAISFSNAWKWKVKVKPLSRAWLLHWPGWVLLPLVPPGKPKGLF